LAAAIAEEKIGPELYVGALSVRQKLSLAAPYLETRFKSFHTLKAWIYQALRTLTACRYFRAA
jgi:hypothetical protein